MLPICIILFFAIFFTPISVVILLYFTSFGLWLYINSVKYLGRYLPANVIEAPYELLAHLYIWIGSIWHGFTIQGLENIPKDGPALLLFYHAPMPVDMYYVNASIITKCKRRPHFVGDRFLKLVPGFQALLEALHIDALDAPQMCALLRQGHLVAVAPGGLREALFSDDMYSMVWNNRVGFAKVWLDTCSVVCFLNNFN